MDEEGCTVRITYWGAARRFYKIHKNAEAPLRAWKRAVLEASWTDFNSVKETFNSVDWVDGLLVFDIKGNDYRLISVCVFENQRLYIKEILTHEEYDEGAWKKKHNVSDFQFGGLREWQ